MRYGLYATLAALAWPTMWFWRVVARTFFGTSLPPAECWAECAERGVGAGARGGHERPRDFFCAVPVLASVRDLFFSVCSSYVHSRRSTHCWLTA